MTMPGGITFYGSLEGKAECGDQVCVTRLILHKSNGEIAIEGQYEVHASSGKRHSTRHRVIFIVKQVIDLMP